VNLINIQRRFYDFFSGNFDRNGWKRCGVLSGNFRALWVETFHRNQWKLWSGIINFKNRISYGFQLFWLWIFKEPEFGTDTTTNIVAIKKNTS
jgi:hypothetical protein